MQTDRRQATVVGGGQQEAAAGAPREMMVPGLVYYQLPANFLIVFFSTI